MDATQKRRMWKVATVHFLASVSAFIFFMYFGLLADRFIDMSTTRIETASVFAWNEVWRNFLETTIAFFQPLLWSVLKFQRAILAIAFFPVIPIWSICFGWLFVKFDNWLNHFPVLGRRVF